MKLSSTMSFLASLLPRFRAGALRIFPYSACLFMAEILYFGAKAVYVYGSVIGIIIAVVATLLLCALIILAYSSSDFPVFVLLIVFGLHAAFVCVGIIEAVYLHRIVVPHWLFILRIFMAIIETCTIVAVCRAESQETGSPHD